VARLEGLCPETSSGPAEFLYFNVVVQNCVSIAPGYG